MDRSYLKTSKEVIATLHTEQTKGLSKGQVKERIDKYGDIVYLEAGDYIPADLRLFLSANLQIR